MKDTDFAFAVARIRANEPKLLTTQELSAAVAAPGFAEAARRLRDKGYEIEGTDYAAALEKKRADVWALVSSVLPDPAVFDSVIIKNDFQNLKVALKALVCDADGSGLYASPSKYDPAEIASLVRERKNDRLPPELQHADRSAYSILTKTRFSQLGEAVIDRAAMEWRIRYAESSKEPLLVTLAHTAAALADLRVAYRCIRAGKAESFLLRSVCDCRDFSKQELAKAAESMERFHDFIAHTPYAAAGEALKESPTAFEKCCDDLFTAPLEAGKYGAFGVAPIAAFYYAAQTELLNVRILLSAKLNGAPDESIRERMRKLYV